MRNDSVTLPSTNRKCRKATSPSRENNRLYPMGVLETASRVNNVEHRKTVLRKCHKEQTQVLHEHEMGGGLLFLSAYMQAHMCACEGEKTI